MRVKSILLILTLFLNLSIAYGQNPEIDQIKLNGNTLQNGRTYNLELEQLSDGFYISIVASNNFGNTAPSTHNWLTLSFPELDNSPKDNVSVVTGQTSRDFSVSEYFQQSVAGKIVDHLFVEAVDNNGWNVGESKTLNIKVEPDQYGIFEIRYRLALGNGDSHDDSDIFRDPSSGSGDNTGYPAYSIYLDIKKPVTPPPEPDIAIFSLPRTITLGEPITVNADVTNSGGDSPTGGITFSFPDMKGSSDKQYVSSNTSTTNTDTYSEFDAGETINTRTGQTSASYLMVEGEEDNWSSSSTRRLSVNVTPQQAGTFRIYVRSAMQGEDGNWYNEPSSGSLEDQQDWPVREYTVEVEDVVAPKPQPQITLSSLPDKITLGESITVKADVKNNGGDSPTGGITFSFPDMEGSSDKQYVSSNTSTTNTDTYSEFDSGETINTRVGQTLASYLMVEGKESSWNGSTDRIMSVNVTPQQAGTFRIYVRSAMQGEDGNWYNEPSSGTQTDQQGWPVQVHTVIVEDPTPELDPSVKAVVVTVDGLDPMATFDGTFGKDLVASKYDNYLGAGIINMGFGSDIRLYPFPWNRDASKTHVHLDRLREFLLKKYDLAKKYNKKFVIVSHSWGTFLAYTALVKEFDSGINLEVDLFITLGSPLGTYYAGINGVPNYTAQYTESLVIGYVDYWIKSLNLNDCNECLPSISRFINYWAWGDIISGPLNEKHSSITDFRVDYNNPHRTSLLTTPQWHDYTSLNDQNELFLKVKDEIWSLLDGFIEPPKPKLVYDFSSSPTIKVGETLNLKLNSTNIGGLATYGSISVSLPEVNYENEVNLNITSNNNDTPGLIIIEKGQTINHRDDYSFSSNHLVLEYGDDSWSSGEENILNIEFTPQETGEFTILIRSNLGNWQNGTYYNTPLESEQIDQQGWPVIKQTVIVESPSNSSPTANIINGPADGSTVNNSSVAFKWTGSDSDGSVVSYEVELSGPKSDSFETSNDFREFINLPNGDYIFRVRAIDNEGAVSEWVERSFTVQVDVILPAPTQLAPADGADNTPFKPTFKWEVIEGADAYILHANRIDPDEMVVDVEVNATSFSPPQNLDTGTTHDWRVRAVKDGVEGEWSPIWSFTTIEDSQPSADLIISDLTVSPASPKEGDSVTFAFEITNQGDEAVGAFDWRVSVDGSAVENGSIGSLAAGATAGGTAEVTNVSSGSYTVEVIADVNDVVSESDESNNETSASYTVGQGEVLAAPKQLAPADGADDTPLKPTFEWEPVEGADAYILHANRINPGEMVVEVELTGTSFTPEQDLDTGTTHDWRVRAVKDGVEGDWSPIWSFTTVVDSQPSADLVVSDLTMSPSSPKEGDTVTFAFEITNQGDEAAGAFDWRVSIDGDETDAGSIGSLVAGGTTAGTTEITNVSQGSYTVTVAADINGEVAESDEGNNEASASYTVDKLVAPSLLAPDDGTTGQPLTPTLDWGAVSGGEEYRVQVSTSSDFGDTVVDATKSTTEHTVAGGTLDYETMYYWRVNAGNEVGVGEWSAVRSFTTKAEPVSAPQPPSLNTPDDEAMGQPLTLTLDWSTVEGAEEYSLQVSASSDFGSTVVDATKSATEHAVAGGALTYETTYYWRVNAGNEVGAGEWSSMRSFTTKAEPVSVPPPPSLDAPDDEAMGQPLTLTLDWSTVEGAEEYSLQVSAGSDFGSTVVDETKSSTDHTVAGGALTYETTYYWRVNAGNEIGAGEWSDTRSFTTENKKITLSVSPENLNFESSSNSKKFSIKTNDSWSVEDDRSWISVSPTSSSGDGSVEVTVYENTGSSSRSGTVTVSGNGLIETVTISQARKNLAPPIANYSQGWNLVSIPEEVSGQSLEDYFSSVSNATVYEFDDQYVEIQSLETGKGYWLKLNANEEVEFTGQILGSLTLNLETGWNLVGTVGDTLSVAGDIQDPSGIIENGSVWALDYDDTSRKYELVETPEMLPGKGYFIKAISAGDIVLSNQ